jgi:hypothetical protein
MTDSRSDGTMWHFSQSVHADSVQGRFSELLRNVASSVDALGNIEVFDMAFKHEITPHDEFLTATVYYDKLDPAPLRVITSDRFGSDQDH